MYRLHFFLCTNQKSEKSCGNRAPTDGLVSYMRRQVKAAGFSLEDVAVTKAGCMGRCAEGPTMVVYPGGIWYKVETEADVDDIIATHLINGEQVERLLMQPSSPAA